ncbi:LacI family transcriptional regulator [Shinella daejeonensis]|uniref:LacI family DNA-binding transcriptional regulator n=1 Tax=Shinella daejeonensis TaxID=659017 RepID=UPI0020C7C3A0|nr:LacI family DNA-binding transcriptional regulator [Shinella daejeonensis]MCP8894952.1 LacI family transcriptional regulator [Shinella daejeonensis]
MFQPKKIVLALRSKFCKTIYVNRFSEVVRREWAGNMVVTIKDVAKLAGVSPGTVSNVFSSNRAVKAELVERVRKAAAELGYEPDRAASQLRAGKARVVAVLLPDLDNPFFTSLVASIEANVRDEGFDIIVASSHGDAVEEARRLSALLAWRPAGLVIVPCSDAFVSRKLVSGGGVPFVVADRVPSHFDGEAVTVDNVGAGTQAAEHLVRLGHRRFVVAASTLRLQNIRDRCEGIEAVLAREGLASPTLIEVGLDFDTASERLGVFMEGEQQATAFIALTNFATLGILASANRSGLSVPRDLSVVGFDDYSWMHAVSPPLTAIRQPVDMMGRVIWSRLRRHIVGRSEPVADERLSCDLVVRASTASPPSVGDALRIA